MRTDAVGYTAVSGLLLLLRARECRRELVYCGCVWDSLFIARVGWHASFG